MTPRERTTYNASVEAVRQAAIIAALSIEAAAAALDGLADGARNLTLGGDDVGRHRGVLGMIRVRLPQDAPGPVRGRADLSPNLAALVDRIAQLRPSHRHSEHLHIEKDEIARALRRLARWTA